MVYGCDGGRTTLKWPCASLVVWMVAPSPRLGKTIAMLLLPHLPTVVFRAPVPSTLEVTVAWAGSSDLIWMTPLCRPATVGLNVTDTLYDPPGAIVIGDPDRSPEAPLILKAGPPLITLRPVMCSAAVP